MRILAIRGENLASLEREFEVDLEAEPLASAGLFAITGNTGAGKSTLLDAMCAALFDRTPRLEGRSPFKVGRGDDDLRVGAFDVRALLRRGAGEGWAEVDFEGKDRRRYRARWEVHRARNKAEGKLQDQRMVLRRLDDGVGHPLGGTRSETQKAIESALGLSFEQFRRSALLAQGEFAAFLRAESSQRASLLERVTGTALYGALSMAAHRRATELAGERRGRRGEVEAALVLDDERRAELEVDAAGAGARLAAARALVAALARAGRWREQVDELTRAEVEAGGRAEKAERAVAAAAAEAREVEAAGAAEPVRGPWRARAQARSRLEQTRGVAAEAAVDAEAAGRAAKEASDQALAARAARQAHDAEVERLAPELARASGLDAAIAAADREYEAAEREAAAAATSAKAAADEAGRRATAAAALVARGATLEAWLQSAAALAPLAADGARWSGLVRRAVATRQAWAAARRELDELVPARHAADGALAVATRAVGQARADYEQAAQRAEVAEEAVRAAPLAPAEQAWLAADQRARRVAEVVTIAAAADARGEERDALLADAAGADHEAARARADGEAAVRDGERAGAALREAGATLDRLRSSASLEHARAALQPGEPCALCGATEHPWAGRGALDALVVEQAARSAALGREVDAAAAGARAAAQRGAVARSQAGDRRAQADRIDVVLADLDDRWRRGLAGLGELALVRSPRAAEAGRWSAELQAAADAALTRAAVARTEAQAAAAAAGLAQARALAARHDLEQVERDRARGADEVGALAARQQTIVRDLDEHGRERARLADELAPALAAIPVLAARLAGDADPAPGPAIVALDEALAAHRAQAALALDVRDRLAGERSALVAAEAARDQLGPVAGRAAEAARSRRDHGRGLRAERAQVLGGRGAGEVTAALRGAGERRRLGEQLAVDEATRAVMHDAAEASRARAAAEQVAAAVTAATAAERELASAIAASRLSADEIGRHLARDPAWLPAARARQATLAGDAARALAVLGEHRRRRAAHLARRSDEVAAVAAAGLAATILDEPAPAWAARLAAATAAAEAEASAGAVLAEQLRVDAAARGRRTRALAALSAFEVDALPFEQLDDLIGSSDGKKLRDFAQSLTLDRLLAAANRHLDDLAPRYQLERVGGLDLELQVVDRELGDDVRAIASLSGGESFLVSLALALGLSSLSSSGVEVRTLLIDEGFGSLDLATLDTALAVLDALRATGRQVGIVSHVPGLDERVPARVVVRALGGGRSSVEVRA